MFYNIREFVTDIGRMAKESRGPGYGWVESDNPDTLPILLTNIPDRSIANKYGDRMILTQQHFCCIITVSADSSSKKRRIFRCKQPIVQFFSILDFHRIRLKTGRSIFFFQQLLPIIRPGLMLTCRLN